MPHAHPVRVDAIRKMFGRTVAIDDVSFVVQPGEIYREGGILKRPAGHAAAVVHHPGCARAREAGVHGNHARTEIVYPMLGLRGLFVPLDARPPIAETVDRPLPFTYAVSLLTGGWHGEWRSSHAGMPRFWS